MNLFWIFSFQLSNPHHTGLNHTVRVERILKREKTEQEMLEG